MPGHFYFFTREIESLNFFHLRIGWKYLFQYLYYIYFNLLCGYNIYFHHAFSYKNIYFQKNSAPPPCILMVAPSRNEGLSRLHHVERDALYIMNTARHRMVECRPLLRCLCYFTVKLLKFAAVKEPNPIIRVIYRPRL